MHLISNHQTISNLYPTEYKTIIEKVKKGNNKLKNQHPSTWIWGFDFGLAIGNGTNHSKQDTDQYWNDGLQNKHIIMTIYTLLKNTSYHSKKITQVPTGFAIQWITQTEKNQKEYLKIKFPIDFSNFPSVFITEYSSNTKKVYAKEHILVGTYANKKTPQENNIITLDDSGLLTLYSKNNNGYNHEGAAAQSFVKSIINALEKNLNTVTFRNKQFNFQNPEETYKQILQQNNFMQLISLPKANKNTIQYVKFYENY